MPKISTARHHWMLPIWTKISAFCVKRWQIRNKRWTERETLIGKVVDFEYLSGATKGRMGRIFRLCDDLVPGTSLGL